jgi:hypothetical protein
MEGRGGLERIGSLLPMKRFLVALVLVAAAARASAAIPADVIDFSSAGYAGGGVPIPIVPAKYAVRPSGGDDTRMIQAALDAAGKRPLDANGFRGAVLLRPGTYRVEGQLHIGASGVVLRGDRATVVATGQSRRTLIQIGGRDDRVLSRAIPVAADTVPAGATKLTLASVDGLAAGTRVVIRRPSTREWIAALGMTNFPGPGQYKDARLDWVPGSRDIEWERTVTACDPGTRTITLDAPITTALEAKYGGATVHTMTWPGRIRNVGVENLDCVCEVDAVNPLDEEHSWICVAVDSAENAWVRRVTARKFVCSAVWITPQARAVTVEDGAFLQPVAEHAGWRRVSFYVDGQQVLVQRCTAEDGRHDFALGHCSAGPNVFLDCTAVGSELDAGPFESWANGGLYDHVSVAGAGISLVNAGAATQGAGWTAANSVVWNCAAASKIWVDDPPGAPNKVIVDESTPSLYRAQREARVGAKSAAAAGGVPSPRQFAADDSRPDIPAAPAPAAAAPEPPHPLSIVNGYFVVDGRALIGDSMNSSLWKGQLIPGREQQMGTSPTRWAPGRTGPHLTEDLDQLTDQMRARHVAIYWSFPGLWYDRRRDDHSIAIRPDPAVWAPFFEPPWRLSGQGRNSMGLSKYDLTKFNPWFFRRLRELAADCTAKGLVMACQVYDNHNVEEAAAHWADFPWRSMNTLQETGFPEPPHWENAGQNRHHIADAFYDPNHPLRRHLHELYIRHTLDVLGDSPNAIFTLGYQFAGPLPFQQFFVDTIAAWQNEHHRRVHIALQTSKAVIDAILADPARAALVDIIDLRYWQYLPDGKLFAPDGKGKLAFRELRTEAFGRDAIMRSTPELVYRQVREYRDRYPDKAVICGHAGFGPLPVLMAGGSEAVVAEATPPRDGPPHDDLATLRFINERVADILPQMKPLDGLAENAWCLAADGRAWMFYSLAGDSIRLAHALDAKNARGVWFNPRDGKVTDATLAPGAQTIAKPSSEAWVLLVR